MMPKPSPNGDNGRGPDGRFQKGNPGGPGNPFARKVAAARKALLDAAGPEQIRAIAETLIRQAVAGDVAAAKLVLRYVVGDVPAALDALLRLRVQAAWFEHPLKAADAKALVGAEPAAPPRAASALEAARLLAEALRPQEAERGDKPLADGSSDC